MLTHGGKSERSDRPPPFRLTGFDRWISATIAIGLVAGTVGLFVLDRL